MVRWLSFCALVVLAAQSGTASAELKPFSVVVEVRKLSNERLTGDLASGFSRFTSQKRYFGAFAFNKEANEYSYWQNVRSLGSAVEFVLSACQQRAKKPCELYAVMVPKGFPKNQIKGSGLNSSSGAGFKDYLAKHKKGKFSAFAISGIGADGYAWGYDSMDEAEQAATLECMGAMASDLADFSKLDRNLVQKMRLTECEVIDVRE